MKRFTFTLQAVLTLRQREERDSLEAYAVSLRVRQQAAEALSEANRMIESIRSLRLQAGESLATAQAMHQMQIRSELAQTVRAEAAQRLASAETDLEKRLRQVMLARQRREAVEHCREVQLQEYAKLEAQEENRLLDEFAARKPVGQLTSFHG